MAGYYNRWSQDGAYVHGRDELDQGQYDYTLYRNAVMRGGVAEAPFMMPVQNVDFYGPLAGNRVTKESFLQGRGSTLSRDPQNEVLYLPSSLFTQPPVKSSCDRVDMLPMFTRLKPSCNGLTETDVTQYWFSPGKYADGYQGYNSVVYSNMQTRVGPDYAPNLYRQCQGNYASYAPTRSFDRYSP
jgi:hypothetical protein